MSRRIHIEVADRLANYAFLSKETPSRPYHRNSLPPLIDLRKHTKQNSHLSPLATRAAPSFGPSKLYTAFQSRLMRY